MQMQKWIKVKTPDSRPDKTFWETYKRLSPYSVSFLKAIYLHLKWDMDYYWYKIFYNYWQYHTNDDKKTILYKRTKKYFK